MSKTTLEYDRKLFQHYDDNKNGVILAQKGKNKNRLWVIFDFRTNTYTYRGNGKHVREIWRTRYASPNVVFNGHQTKQFNEVLTYLN